MPITYDITTDYLYQEGIAEGKAEGIAEGEAKGKVEEKRKTIERMIIKGYSDTEISELADASIEEVKKIRKRLT